MHQEPEKKWLPLLGIYPKGWVYSLQNNWLLIKKMKNKEKKKNFNSSKQRVFKKIVINPLDGNVRSH